MFPLLVGFSFQEVSRCSWSLPSPPLGYGCVLGAFPWLTLSLLPLVSGLSELHSLWLVPVVLGPPELLTLPSGCLWSQSPIHRLHSSLSTSDLGSIFPTAPQECWVGGCVEWRLELLVQENSPNCPRGSFSFWENPPAQSWHSIQGRACPLTQPTSPARPGTIWVTAPNGPTLNFPQVVPTVSVCLPLHPYSSPCDFKQPGLSQCCSSLVWQGREPLTRFSPKSPAAGLVGAGWGCCVP